MAGLVVPRREWEARAPKSVDGIGIVENVYVHHTVSKPSGLSHAAKSSFMRGIQSYHMSSQGWSDIAYSFVLFQDGTVYEARGWGRAGAHTYMHNSDGYGFCAAGNFVEERPTPELLEAYRNLIALGVREQYLRPRPNIVGHRDVGAAGGGTACPGDKLYARLEDIRQVSHLKPISVAVTGRLLQGRKQKFLTEVEELADRFGLRVTRSAE